MSEQLKLEDEEINITLRRAWDRALRTLSARVNKPTFETHIRTLRPMSLAEETLSGKSVIAVTLGVPSAFTREWVEKRHAPLIASILEEIFDRDVRLRFALSPKEPPTAAGAAALAGSQNGTSAGPGDLFSEPAAPVDGITVAPVVPSPAMPRPRTQTSATAPTEGIGDTGKADTGAAALLELEPPALTELPKPKAAPAATPSVFVTPRPSAPTRNGHTSGGGGSKGSTPDAPQLNHRYTFENFVTGPTNRLAQAGARAVADSPGQVYNPLFLYGPSGLGKTHLMHAIGNEYMRANGDGSQQRIAYISGEAFTSHYIASLRERRADEFRRRWNSVDLWLVDDIQFIAGKEHTKEEFFHTFNALYQTGKQIVISSDRSPRELRMMDERLRSRFECGLIADIAPPDLETRLAILHQKADLERMRIPDDVLLYMARLVQSNIRTLEGALVKLIAYASLVNSPVTTDLASNVLERYFISAGFGATGEAGGNGEGSADGAGTTASGRNGGGAGSASPIGGLFGAGSAGITPEIVQRVVTRRFGLAPDALAGQKRGREVARARQIAMHLMRELTEVSLPGIGEMFGGRTHSTVAHACDQVRAQLPFDDDLRTLVEDLTTQIQAQQKAAG